MRQIKNLNRLKEKTEYLAEFMLEGRKERIEEVLAQRTRYLTVVLEDIYHAPNASAVIRSCECFGIQNLHVIENTKRYKPNTDVVRGAAKWIDLSRYRQEKNNTATCLENLKKAGYKVVATSLKDEKAIKPEDLPLTDPVALVFGTEELGVSDVVYELADYNVKIPMYGFTDSFNISVATALCLQPLSAKLRLTEPSSSKVGRKNSQIAWQLSENEKNELRFQWYQKSVKNSQKLLAQKFGD